MNIYCAWCGKIINNRISNMMGTIMHPKCMDEYNSIMIKEAETIMSQQFRLNKKSGYYNFNFGGIKND